MASYLLDTNALSLFLRGRDRPLAERIYAARRDCLVSAVAWFELEYGRLKSVDPIRTGARLALLRTYFVDLQAFGAREAELAGWVRFYLGTLKPNAQPIGHYDVLLAGQALALGAVLVTHNVKEFARVPGLVLEDWQTE
jgi:tRNA(fMet)-specific endonuclease VapC